METHDAAEILQATNAVRRRTHRALDTAGPALVVFGALTLASIPFGLSYGGPGLGMFWLVGGPLGGIAVALLHIRRERSAGVGQRAERNWVSGTMALGIMVVAFAAYVIAPGWSSVAPQTAALLGFTAFAAIDRHSRLAALGITFVALAIVLPVVFGLATGVVLSTAVIGVAMVIAGAIVELDH
jgi:hypothetical protein